MKINLINPEAITTLVTAVNAKLAAGEKVNRSTVLTCLGYSDEEAKDANLKNAISAAFNADMITGLKLTQKLGVVSSEHLTGKEQKEVNRKSKADLRAKKQEEKSKAQAQRAADKAAKAAEKAAATTTATDPVADTADTTASA